MPQTKMNYLNKLIIASGIEPNIALYLSILLFAFRIMIIVLYICVPFILLRIRKEIIKLNSHLQNLDILYTGEKIRGEKVVCDDAEFFYDERPSKDSSKYQLDDEDIEKLKAIGSGME